MTVDLKEFSTIERPDGIIEYHFTKFSRESVNAWFETTTRHDQVYHTAGRHLQRLIFFDGNLIPTPYLISRANEATALTPLTLRESQALIIPHNLIAYQMMALFLNNLPLHREGISRTQVFKDAESGLAWLHQRRQALGE